MADNPDLRAAIEALLKEHEWADDTVQRALLEVARNHLWRQGLWARLRFAANVIGILGIVGGGAMALASVMGFEIVRRSP